MKVLFYSTVLMVVLFSACTKKQAKLPKRLEVEEYSKIDTRVILTDTSIVISGKKRIVGL